MLLTPFGPRATDRRRLVSKRLLFIYIWLGSQPSSLLHRDAPRFSQHFYCRADPKPSNSQGIVDALIMGECHPHHEAWTYSEGCEIIYLFITVASELPLNTEGIQVAPCSHCLSRIACLDSSSFQTTVWPALWISRFYCFSSHCHFRILFSSSTLPHHTFVES